jgi:hypothetical protein
VARNEFQYGRALLKADRAGEALEWIQHAAEKDYTAAWHMLGVMYTRGAGVAKDDASAVTWFRKAANRGYAPAQSALGDLYAQGLGVTRDDGEAVHWFRKAAEQDYAAAQGRLGAMYAQGFGVAQDDSEALQWLRKSAAQGDSYGQAWLGYMYAQGRGTAQDLREAERWLSKSAEQGYAWAAERLKEVLSQQEISRMPFSDARVENEYFVFEEERLSRFVNAISAEFVLKPKRNIKMLLTHDWLVIDDERGNLYHLSDTPAYFKTCGYDSNSCLEKNFKLYKGGQPVKFGFRIGIVDRKKYDNNPPHVFKFLINFLVFRPDGGLVMPVAIRVPLGQS